MGTGVVTCVHIIFPQNSPLNRATTWARLSLKFSVSVCLSLCVAVSFTLCFSVSLSPCVSPCVSGQPPSCTLSQQDCSPSSPRVRSWLSPPSPPTTLLGLSSPPSASLGPQPHTGTDRVRVRTIQGAWPSEGTASSIRGWVLTKLRISSGKALEALYCMPGAAQHPGLDGDGGWSGQMWGSPYRGSDSPGDTLPCPKGLSVPHLRNGYS